MRITNLIGPDVWPWRATAALLLALMLYVDCASGCTTAGASNSTSSAYLIINALLAAPGATPAAFSGVLASDVLSVVTQTVNGQQVSVPTVFEDPGQATFQLALKDPGTTASPTAPTTTNFITITRYHVAFTRTDGHNTEGVDVPNAFDGATTVTVGVTPVSATIVLVRAAAKQQAPLVALVGGNGEISTIAQVTFYGADQTGRAVSVTGSIGVNFADWGG
jgi:hypothetical protein